MWPYCSGRVGAPHDPSSRPCVRSKTPGILARVAGNDERAEQVGELRGGPTLVSTAWASVTLAIKQAAQQALSKRGARARSLRADGEKTPKQLALPANEGFGPGGL